MSEYLNSLTDAAGRLGAIGTGLLEDRLELLTLEAQEAKIRLAQIVLLVCAGSLFTVFGIILLMCAVICLMPLEWRPYGLLGAAAVSLLLGAVALLLLNRVFKTAQLPFAATVQEIKKDVACFSTRN